MSRGEQRAEGPIRVMIVDDHPLMRRGMRCAMERGDGIQVVGEADSLSLLFEEALRLGPDVVLLDVWLPDGNSLDSIQELRERCPRMKIVVVTALQDDSTVVRRAMACGADGFLSKSVTSKEMVDAVRGAYEGLSPFTRDATALLVRPTQDDRCARLTRREIDTLTLLSEGRSNSEIARALFISECTVKFHVRHIFDKLGVRNRVEAASAFRECQVA